MDNIKGDPRQNGLTRKDAQDRARWKRDMSTSHKSEKMKTNSKVISYVGVST